MFVSETAKITFENNDEFYKSGIPYTGTVMGGSPRPAGLLLHPILLPLTPNPAIPPPAQSISPSLLLQMLLKGTNISALMGKEFLLVVNTGRGTQRKTLHMDGSGRASFQLDTSGWTEGVFLRVSDPCPTPLRHFGFSKDH